MRNLIGQRHWASSLDEVFVATAAKRWKALTFASTVWRRWLRSLPSGAVQLIPITLVLALLAVPAIAQDSELKKIFDGQTLEGWKANENPDSWKVQDGCLVCNGPRSHLFYVGDDKPFKNFHFKADVETTKGSNAGIYFHTKYQETGWPRFGYECQVNVSHTDPKKSSGLYGTADVADPGISDDQWYTQEIIVNGRHILLKINGKTLTDYTEPENKPANSEQFERRLGEGTFALQAHDPQSLVYFKNIYVKRLP